jgi:hypothetical protein
MYCPSIEARALNSHQKEVEFVKKTKDEKYAAFVKSNLREPYHEGVLGYNDSKKPLSKIEIAMKNAADPATTFSAPMLISWYLSIYIYLSMYL